MSLSERIRIQNTKIISDDVYVLKQTRFEFLRSDGHWQSQRRETYEKGDGAAILLYNLDAGTIVLVRQFRYPAYVHGYKDLLLEAPARMLDSESPETRILKEVKEETGFRVKNATKIFEAFMSPGALTEKIYFFIAEYSAMDRFSQGGGLQSEGEDLEVLELCFDAAFAMIAGGGIHDAKTIMLLQYAAFNIFRK